jgi:hypothetical protein
MVGELQKRLAEIDRRLAAISDPEGPRPGGVS